MKKFLKIGHRGACGYQPENTLASFQKALDLSVDAIELDVYQCKTREIIVFHDLKVNRTTNGKGYIENKTFNEIRNLDAGNGQLIPTLEEVLDLVDNKCIVNIELKGENTANKVADIIDYYICNRKWNIKNFLVSSFNHVELKRFKDLMPNISIGVLIEAIPVDYSNIALSLNADYINLSMDFINKEFVEHAHNNGLKVLVYTVNDFDDIKKMKNLDVDGIFSNFPDRL